MMYDICFSILCHDDFDYVSRWINLAQKLNPNCCWIFHVSESSSDSFVRSMQNLPKHCFVNPERLSSKPNQISVDISNFRMSEGIEYQYFSTDHITSFPFRASVYSSVSKYKFGMAKNWFFNEWNTGSGQEAINNSNIQRVLRALDLEQNQIIKIQNEGMTLPKNNSKLLFDTIESIIHNDRTCWVEQEFMYGTVLNHLKCRPDNASPTVFYEAERSNLSRLQMIQNILEYKRVDLSIPSSDIVALKKIDNDSIEYLMDYYHVS